MLFRSKSDLVSEAEALPGRTDPTPVPADHTVLHHPLTPPWPDGLATAVFGLGCFWGAEKLFWQTPGVYSTAAGYAGGFTPNPSYEEVCSGRTEQTMPVPAAHHVNGHPLVGPWPEGMETAVFGMGCFWGAERIFWQLPGVYSTAVGYAGGHTPNPTYEETCSALTGHAEVVLVVFDPAVVSYDSLLKVFWEGHDPTQGMRQGNDVGTQYRSAVFPIDDAQHAEAEAAIARWNAEHEGQRAVTTIEGPAKWYPDEEYHQEYWEGEGQRNPYCLATIPPKLLKLRKSFQAKVKSA